MNNPQKVPHADLIDDWPFMEWCKNSQLYENCDVAKWRSAYIAFVQQDRTARDAAKILHVCIDHVYVLVRNYEAAATKYKAERDAKDSS